MKRSVIVVCVTLGLVGCGGGATNSIPVSASSTAPLRAPNALVTFNMNWADRTPAGLRRPGYVAATARSVTIVTNPGSQSSVQVLNAPGSTLSFSAPTGQDTFQITVYDEQNGQGNIVGVATVTETVSNAQANVVSAIINGVIASLQVSLSNPSPPAGGPAAPYVYVTALDADGNTITGPGDYNTPITVAINDPWNSGTLSLTKTVLQNPYYGTILLNYNGGILWDATITASANGAPTASARFMPAPTTYIYPIPGGTSSIENIAAPPSGNSMWFTVQNPAAIARVTPQGAITVYNLPTTGSQPIGIVGGDNNAMYLTEYHSGNVVKSPLNGPFAEYPVTVSGPEVLALGTNGVIWIGGTNQLGWISENGGPSQTINPVTANSYITNLAVGPDGDLYYVEYQGVCCGSSSKLARYDPAQGVSAEATLPTNAGTNSEISVAAGPDGNMWIAEPGRSKIGVVSPSSFSVVAEYPTLSQASSPAFMTAGRDGAMWFYEYNSYKIGHVTTKGIVTEYPAGAGTDFITSMAVGNDGAVWMLDYAANAVLKFMY